MKKYTSWYTTYGTCVYTYVFFSFQIILVLNSQSDILSFE